MSSFLSHQGSTRHLAQGPAVFVDDAMQDIVEHPPTHGARCADNALHETRYHDEHRNNVLRRALDLQETHEQLYGLNQFRMGHRKKGRTTA